MKAAGIDIGTNSILMLIAERIHNSEIKTILDVTTITRLGKGVDSTGKLNTDSMDRSCKTLAQYKHLVQQHEVHQARIVGTSALREATNASAFLELVRDRCNLTIEIITGEEEAELAMRGVCTAKYVKPSENLLIVDIGGGSTEFIFCYHSNIKRYSMNIGSVRLTERVIKSDPPHRNDVDHVSNIIYKHLNNLPLFDRKTRLIGVAGTVTTLGAISLEMNEYDHTLIDGYHLSFSQVSALKERLMNMTVEQRKQLKGLEPARADVIPVGTTILWCVMKKFGFQQVIISDRGVRYGIVHKLLTSETR